MGQLSHLPSSHYVTVDVHADDAAKLGQIVRLDVHGEIRNSQEMVTLLGKPGQQRAVFCQTISHQEILIHTVGQFLQHGLQSQATRSGQNPERILNVRKPSVPPKNISYITHLG